MQREELGLRKDTALVQVHTAGWWPRRKEFAVLLGWFQKQPPSQDTPLLQAQPLWQGARCSRLLRPQVLPLSVEGLSWVTQAPFPLPSLWDLGRV